DLTVTASGGSAYVDGQPAPTGVDRASVGGALTVSALDDILVDATSVGGAVSLTETAGDSDGQPDRILANIDDIGGSATLSAADGDADLIVTNTLAGDLSQSALNGDARTAIGTFDGDNLLVDWSAGTVRAEGSMGMGNVDIQNLRVGPADLVNGLAGSDPRDVAVSGTFRNFNLAIEADFGVVLGGGVVIAGDTGQVTFDDVIPVPSRPVGSTATDGIEDVAVNGGSFAVASLVIDRGQNAMNPDHGNLTVIADRGSYSADPAMLRILGDRGLVQPEVAGQDILQAPGTVLTVAGNSTLDANTVSDVILTAADNNFGSYHDDPANNLTLPIGRVHVRGETVQLTDASDIHFGAVVANRLEVTTANDGSVFFRQVLGLDRSLTQTIRDGSVVGGEGAVGDVVINSDDDVVIGVLADPTDPNAATFDPLLSAPGEPGFREDIFYVRSLNVQRAPGRIILPRTAATNANFDANNAYFGVNIARSFWYAGGHELIDLTGFLRVTRTQVAGLLPHGPRSARYRFNNCVIGDTNTCGSLPPVDLIYRISDEPNLFELDRDQLDFLYVPIGNEELWGVPEAMLYNLDHQVSMASFAPMAMGPWTIYFGFDRSNVAADQRQAIDEAAQAAAGGNGEVVVTGHTDTSGPASYNLGLSSRRAQSVVSMLNADGVGSDRINVSATGEADLAVPTADGVREPKNRRVEIRVLK
ncbi:MAG: OmpA family protein, partial [Rhodospirillaceae bacterium]|nr:OmpA family protein [Rhodospirillaceae bacterium]